MLVLTRKLGENIRIGDSVKITVLEVRSGQVKLGIEAPPEVKVHREEIYARIQEENRRGPHWKTGGGAGGKPGGGGTQTEPTTTKETRGFVRRPERSRQARGRQPS